MVENFIEYYCSSLRVLIRGWKWSTVLSRHENITVEIVSEKFEIIVVVSLGLILLNLNGSFWETTQINLEFCISDEKVTSLSYNVSLIGLHPHKFRPLCFVYKNWLGVQKSMCRSDESKPSVCVWINMQAKFVEQSMPTGKFMYIWSLRYFYQLYKQFNEGEFLFYSNISHFFVSQIKFVGWKDQRWRHNVLCLLSALRAWDPKQTMIMFTHHRHYEITSTPFSITTQVSSWQQSRQSSRIPPGFIKNS